MSEWQSRVRRTHNDPNAKRILVATSTGGHLPGIALEGLLGIALTLRKAKVDFLLCDKVLPACLMCLGQTKIQEKTIEDFGPQKEICNTCFSPAMKLLKEFEFPIQTYSEYITPAEREEARRMALTTPMESVSKFEIGGCRVGEHSLAGALRFFARATLDDEPAAEKILRRYFEAGLITYFSFSRLLETHKYEAVAFHHGIYIPQGIIGELCRKKGVRVINWTPGYRKKCFIFSHGDTYHHTLMTEPVEKWENLELTPAVDKKIGDYLKSRWEGTQDWIWFHEKPDFNLENIAKEVGLDPKKPCVGMLTNVMWDAQLHYPANAFPNMLEWVITTIRYFIDRPDLQLLLRVHPAEIRGTVPSKQPIIDEIKKVFPKLPSNIFLIGPESRVSTYVAMSICNSVIIFGTKTGVELSSVGIPVVVAGEAWIRNKGMTTDASSISEYLKILERLPFSSRMSKAEIERARKYAFHFFFRRMIEMDCMSPKQGWPPYEVKVDTFRDLEQGKDLGLDVVCDGILTGSDFILKYENNL